MSINVQCPGCEKKLKTKDELAGKRVKCPGCGHAILVPAAHPSAIYPSQGKSQVPKKAETEASTTPFSCPHCGKRLRIKAGVTNKSILCPNKECGQRIQVSGAEVPVKPSEETAPCSKCKKRMPGRYFSFWVVEHYKVLVSVTTNTGYKDYSTMSQNAHEERSFLCFECLEHHNRILAYIMAFCAFGVVAFCVGFVSCFHSDPPLSNVAWSLICAGSLLIGLLALGVTWCLARLGVLKWDARVPTSASDEYGHTLLAAEARRAEFEAFHRIHFGMVGKSRWVSFYRKEDRPATASACAGKDLLPPPSE